MCTLLLLFSNLQSAVSDSTGTSQKPWKIPDEALESTSRQDGIKSQTLERLVLDESGVHAR